MGPCDLRELGFDIPLPDCLTQRDRPIKTNFTHVVTFATRFSGVAITSVYKLWFLDDMPHATISVKVFIIL